MIHQANVRAWMMVQLSAGGKHIDGCGPTVLVMPAVPGLIKRIGVPSGAVVADWPFQPRQGDLNIAVVMLPGGRFQLAGVSSCTSLYYVAYTDI